MDSQSKRCRCVLAWLLALLIAPCTIALGAGGEKHIPPPTGPASITVDFRIAQKQVVGGAKIIKARRGDSIALRFTSDQADEIHVHGYDLLAHLVPGVPGVITVSLTMTGRFAIEGHTSRLEMGAIEVYP